MVDPAYDLSAMEPAPAADGDPGPFKFLDFYEEPDAPRFGGRDRDVREILARISLGGTLVLYGRSGLGKTSLLLAGVFPELRRRDYLPVYIRTLEQPTEDLRAAVARAAGVDEGESDADLRELLAVVTRERPVVLVLDQFEELFIRFPDPGTRRSFGELIGGILSDNPNVSVVLSLREDYLARLDDLRPWIRDLLGNQYRLMPLSAFGSRQAITCPLRASRVDADSRLISLLVDRLAEFGFDSVMLQIICSEVYRAATQRDADAIRLTEQDLTDLGGFDGIFQRYLNAAIAEVPKDLELLSRIVMDALITQEETKRATRASNLLERVRATEAEVESILTLFYSKRLVRRERIGDQWWFELAHEALVPTIRQWLDSDRTFFEFRAVRDLLTSCARSTAWKGNYALLLAAPQIALVEVQEARLPVSESEAEFALASSIYHASKGLASWCARTGMERTRELLRTMLRSNDEEAQVRAAEAVARLGGEAASLAEECLQLSLGARARRVRQAAARALGVVDRREPMQRLRDALRERATARASLEAITELARLRDPLHEFGLTTRFRARRRARRQLLREHAVEIKARARMGRTWGFFGGLCWYLTTGMLVAVVAGTVWGNPVESVGMLTTAGLPVALVLGLLCGGDIARRNARRQALGRTRRPSTTILLTWSGFLPPLVWIAIMRSIWSEETMEPVGEFIVLALSPLAYWGFSIAAAALALRCIGSGRVRPQTALAWSVLASLGLPLLVPFSLWTMTREVLDKPEAAAFGLLVGVATSVLTVIASAALAMSRPSVPHEDARQSRSRRQGPRAAALLLALASFGLFLQQYGLDLVDIGPWITVTAGEPRRIEGQLEPGYFDRDVRWVRVATAAPAYLKVVVVARADAGVTASVPSALEESDEGGIALVYPGLQRLVVRREVSSGSVPYAVELSVVRVFDREFHPSPGGRTIPDADPRGVTSEIEVSEPGQVRAVAVFVEIDHPRPKETRLDLVAPSGKEVRLAYVARRFLYSSATGGSLKDVVGERLAGTWKLRVTDGVGGDEGSLVRWLLLVDLASDAATPPSGE